MDGVQTAANRNLPEETGRIRSWVFDGNLKCLLDMKGKMPIWKLKILV